MTSSRSSYEVAFNVKDLRDGDVVVVRCAQPDDDPADVLDLILETIEKLNREADVTTIVLRPGENLELMDEDDMRRFGWTRL